MKTMTVKVTAQVVSSDGIPVNGRNVEWGRGWQKNIETVKRRIRLAANMETQCRAKKNGERCQRPIDHRGDFHVTALGKAFGYSHKN